MYIIKFKYRDKYTNGEWNEQECVCSSIEECKKFYGLGIDCEYEIVSIEKNNRKERSYGKTTSDRQGM